ncbi:MAG: diadenylate cyclase CdaA [Acidobacteriota bacterium]
MSKLDGLLQLLTWRDLADILAVALVLYYLLQLIRGTRAVQMLLGILFGVVVYDVARLLRLQTLESMLQKFLLVLPFAVVVLFQHEIRRALANFGRNPFWRWSSHHDAGASFGDIVLAATTLAGRRIGALIVIERLEGLREYIENGILLNADLSYDLLINVFTPDTPLHDGAVIVQNERLAAAACFLPLSSNPEVAKELGTRHRAALGISEETDAVAIVVSEETGGISVAFAGQLTRDLDDKGLRNTLLRLLVTEVKPRRRSLA